MWTRNYKNILKTLATCCAYGGSGTGTTSPYPISDNYFFNFKAPNGSVYQIRNWCTSSTNNYYSTFLGMAWLEYNHTLSASCSLITNETSSFSNTDGYRIYYALGSDATEPTELDYKLGSFISTLTSVRNVATPTLNEDGTITVNFDIIVQATDDITVREIGLYKRAVYCHTYAYYALVNRIILEEPVSIASGQTATIQFSVTTPTINFA